MDISEKIKFYDVCVTLEKIQKATSLKTKEQHLKKFMESFFSFQEKFKKEHGPSANASFYCVLRLLVPNSDTARDSYGLQVTAMGKLYIKVLNLSPSSEDALKLTYKSSTNQPGDFAEIVYSIMKGRATETSNKLTLGEVHKMLDTIAEKDIRTKENTLAKFIEISSALEQKWLISIILKKLHIRMGEKIILSLYHPEARNLYTSNTDLKSLCEQIENGIQSQDITDNVCPFKHVRPMLCKQLRLMELNTLLEDKTYFLETKMDGERFHLHMLDEIYKYISRNGKDYTLHFGRTSSEGNLTPLLYKLFQISIKNIILDGEMMVWDKSSMSYLVKGENIDVKHLQNGSNLRPCFVVYDLLYLNNISYIDKPYKERCDLLRKIIKEQCGVLAFCKRDKIRDSEHFKECFNEILNKQEEGVVIKDQLSRYLPGIRGGGWYKVKADYIKDLVTDFDLLILGGFYNKKRSFIESYLLGVYKKSDCENDKFYIVGRVSSGLSYIQHRELNERLQNHWVQFKHNNNGKFEKNEVEKSVQIEWGSTIPDVWIEPKNSIILQVKASELHQSNNYGTPYAMRFARIQTIRNDKIWNECMTLEEYEEFYKNSNTGVKKINKRLLTSEDFVPSKKSKSIPMGRNSINPYCGTFKENEIEKVSEEFNGISICILSGSKKHQKNVIDLKAMVVKHSGKVIENPISDHNRCICVAGDLTTKVTKLKDTGLYNIVSVDWLIQAFSGDKVSSKLSQIKPSDMIYATSDMKEKLNELYDEYGDSYTEKVDIEELEQLLKTMDSKILKPLTDSELLKLEEELDLDASIQNIFRMVQGCFYLSKNDDNISNILEFSKLTFELRGGCILDCNDLEQKRKIKIIFVDPHDIDCDTFKIWLNAFFEKRLSKIQIVSYKWILDCNLNNKKLNLSDYLVFF